MYYTVESLFSLIRLKCCPGPMYVPDLFQMLLSVTEVLQHLLKPVTIDFKQCIYYQSGNGLLWLWKVVSLPNQHRKQRLFPVCNASVTWTLSQKQIQMLTRHSCSSSPLWGVAVVNKWRITILFLALAPILSSAVPFIFYHCLCYRKEFVTPGRGESNSPLSSQKKKAAFPAVCKPARLVQVLELYLHDWHQVTEVHVLCSPSCSSSMQSVWMVWHCQFTCLEPLDKNWVTLRRAALQLLCNLSLEFCPGSHTSGTEGVAVLQHQLSFQSDWAGFGLVGFNTIYILMAFKNHSNVMSSILKYLLPKIQLHNNLSR